MKALVLLRCILGHSQRAVADRADISRAYYMACECGRRAGSTEMWTRVADAIMALTRERLQRCLRDDMPQPPADADGAG